MSAARPSDALVSDEIANLAAQLRLATTRLARRMRSEAEIGLSPSMIAALASVHVHGPMTLGDLAAHEHVAKPTVTKIVARLEQDGLVQRETDAQDRRVCRVSATQAGEDLLAATRARKNAYLAGRLAELAPEERDRLAAALDVLVALASGARE